MQQKPKLPHSPRSGIATFRRNPALATSLPADSPKGLPPARWGRVSYLLEENLENEPRKKDLDG
jgi:hypothetical protein